ncbi:MAG: hypothetical protein N2235_09405 [Fischerella sp.]|nr:hypothetical protein [Fischerella sp.]
MKIAVITKTIIPCFGFLILLTPQRTHAQQIPQPWVSFGGKDGDVTYSVGARALNWGAELGFGPDNATGFDVLKFLSLPVVSPYLGLGYYSEDKGLAVSGGVQVGAGDNLFLGVGYNSVRGINGQLGIKF